MRSKKSVLASALLLMALGSAVSCSGEPKPLIDPGLGTPLTEQDLAGARLMFGLSNPTQKELNDAYIQMRQTTTTMFGGEGDAEVHPNALAAE